MISAEELLGLVHHSAKLVDEELSIDRNLHGIRETICFRRHAENSKKFRILFVGQALGTSRRRMRMNAVATAIRSRHSDVHQFFRERVEHAWFDHDLPDARPCPFKQVRVVGESTPEIVNEI